MNELLSDAKQAAETAGWPAGTEGYRRFCEGYNTATAKLREELEAARNLIQRLLDTSEAPAHEKHGTRLDARHWLKGQQPSATTPERKEGDCETRYDPPLSSYSGEHGEIETTAPDLSAVALEKADVEKIARELKEELDHCYAIPCRGADEVRAISDIRDALAQALAPLVADKERLDWLENNYGAICGICGIEQSRNKSFREWISDFIADHNRVRAALWDRITNPPPSPRGP